MKSVIKSEHEEQPIKFPCLMEFDGLVVLFTNETSGTLVHGYKGSINVYPIGQYYNNWEIRRFKPFTGTIELSN